MFSTEKLCEIYKNEQVLMVLISRLYFAASTVDEVQQFIDTNNIDWDLFRRIVKGHQVRPFIHHVIKTTGLTVDATFLNTLKKETFKTGIASLHQLRTLTAIIHDLKNSNIKVIPYKGVLFGSRYYKSFSLRENSDIDLFVDKAEVREIRAYFHKHHYVAKEDVPDDFLNYLLFFYRDISFKSQPDELNVSCTIEIQWKLVDRFVGNYAGFDFFSKYLEDIDVSENKMPGLSTTYDFLCVMSNHFFKEHFNRFKYVIDMACLISQKNAEIDKKTVAKIVRKYRFSNFFSDSIQCIDDLLGISYDHENKHSQHYAAILNNAVVYPARRSEKNDRIVFDLQNSFADKLILVARRLLYFILPNYNDIVIFKRRALFLPILFITKPIRLLSKRLGNRKPVAHP